MYKPGFEVHASPVRQIEAARIESGQCKPVRVTPGSGRTSLYDDAALVALLAKPSTPDVKVSGCAGASVMETGIGK